MDDFGAKLGGIWAKAFAERLDAELPVYLTELLVPQLMPGCVQYVEEHLAHQVRQLDPVHCTVRRVAKRQSCLWRHSFDWHNRRRGHPTHRSA